MRSILIVFVCLAGLGFLWMVGYTIHQIYRDYGLVAMVLASLSTTVGFIALGFLAEGSRKR